ncbi:Pyridoxal-phosphate dependent enzyme [Asaccharospora irregularis DSM 2635]|uniref:Pyridoxal-phosphate dependent enzyme n=1 Tax=Asaccharospora irregularis DSM 2635 TaxID=1121321 RepID=A0A1M5M1V0_9FIRM|nr:pyridoxal-phosphate dependent enzyme [Asaccharospora irregularis]SHG71287.1 Pyridoxal-phosphate dependent enzyme [Asaccharospora irregularis DSM 2635]
MAKVTLQDIKDARETIKDIVRTTDILESNKLSALTGAKVFYKCENLQKTGSFKIRGACNKIAS